MLSLKIQGEKIGLEYSGTQEKYWVYSINTLPFPPQKRAKLHFLKILESFNPN